MMKFIPNPAGLEELARSPGMVTKLLLVAGELSAEIRALTPILATPQTEGSNAAAPGEMRDSVVPLMYDGLVYVAALDRRFHWIEFGTGTRYTHGGAYRGLMPAFHPFVRACEATGQFIPLGRVRRMASGANKGSLRVTAPTKRWTGGRTYFITGYHE